MGFERVDDALVADWEPFEVALVTSLVGQVNELLGAGRDAERADDPFARWEGEFGPVVELDHDDPVIRRLFPDAYADDPVASAEHHRYTEDQLRRGRIADGRTVVADLDATREGTIPLVVADSHVEAWVRALNGVRLSLAVRLGVETDADLSDLARLPARDPRSQLVSLYDWLAWVLESLLDAGADAD